MISPGSSIPTIVARRCRNGETVGRRHRGRVLGRLARPRRCGGDATHRAASERLYRIKDRALALIRERLASNTAVTEFDVQEAMVGWFASEGLISDARPCVAAQENAGNPHYQPTSDAHRAIGRNEVVLLDLWGKLPSPGAVFADITGPIRRRRAARHAGVRVIVAGRDAGRAVRAASAGRHPRLGGRPATRCDHGRRLRRIFHPPHGPQPRARCTATACTWTTTRRTTSVIDSRHRLHDRRAPTTRRSGCGQRSPWRSASAMSTGPQPNSSRWRKRSLKSKAEASPNAAP